MASPERADARVVAAVDGDVEALEELLREHGPRVAARLSVDPRWARVLDVADVMQVSYLEAFLRVRALRSSSTASFVAWLSRCAENNLRDALRELSREKRPDAHRRHTGAAGGDSARTLLAGLAGADPTAGGLAARREAVERLQAAIGALPESYARVVRALDLEERPAAEVAAELGRSPGAVHMLRSRAHDRLRELLAGRPGFSADSA